MTEKNGMSVVLSLYVRIENWAIIVNNSRVFFTEKRIWRKPEKKEVTKDASKRPEKKKNKDSYEPPKCSTRID